MCGIWCVLGAQVQRPEIWVKALKARGPEDMRVTERDGYTLGFTRLAINGLRPEGMQPMFLASEEGGRLWWMCNGEIYNWRELAAQYGIETTSGSDCEVLGPLFRKFQELDLGPAAFFRALDGVFAMVLVDEDAGVAYVARDPYGVRPLYSGRVKDGVAFASEMKAMVPLSSDVAPFPPGTWAQFRFTGSGDDGGGYFFSRRWAAKEIGAQLYHTVPALAAPVAGADEESYLRMVRDTLTAAVRKRMLMERPVAALLSGGLDSSLIAALVQRELREAGKPALKTFSIGMEGSTDLRFARIVAEHIGSDHTEIKLTADEFFAAVPAVIRDIESYDTTTVRASVGNWLVSRAIAAQTDCKVVFNGDGSDEVWGSYLYFKAAPSDHAFEEEVTRLLAEIHTYDVLRSDRSISSHGLEPRTPFLDKTFVAAARLVPTAWRRAAPEKGFLRRAFAGTGLLPDAVLWRQKEAFSDGVSSLEKSWYEICQEKAGELVPANWAEEAERRFGGHLTPDTAEKFYYRSLYEGLYGRETAAVNVPKFWMPRWVATKDPSARTLGAVYSAGAE